MIPPAWKDVWICPYPMGHIQATGVDAAGRKQYLYHPKWREQRDRAKFDDMIAFAKRPARSCARASAEILERDDALTPRARARVRAAPARPRLLPDRLRGLRGHQRDLRPRDDAQGARRARGRRHDGLRLPRQVRRAARAGRGRPAALRHRRRSSSAGAAGGDELLAYKEGRRWRDVRSADINAFLKEIDRRRPLRQGLPHLERDAARRGGARRQRRGRRHQDRAASARSRARSRRSRTTSATPRPSAAPPTSTRA